MKIIAKITEHFDSDLCEQIVTQTNLIKEIFFSCLFSKSDEITKEDMINKTYSSEKCQRYDNRQAAFDLLTVLSRKNSAILGSILNDCLLELFGKVERHDGWKYSPPSDTKPKDKFVGIKNLGCICYMNSILQQFFMVPPLRYQLLTTEDGLPEEMVEYKGRNVDDNMLH